MRFLIERETNGYLEQRPAFDPLTMKEKRLLVSALSAVAADYCFYRAFGVHDTFVLAALELAAVSIVTFCASF